VWADFCGLEVTKQWCRKPENDMATLDHFSGELFQIPLEVIHLSSAENCVCLFCVSDLVGPTIQAIQCKVLGCKS